MSELDDDENMLVPKATVAKFLRSEIPGHLRTSNELRELIVKSATEFIQLLSSEAAEVCNRQNKSKITPEHLFEAMGSLGMDAYLEEVKALGNEVSSGKKERNKQVKDAKNKMNEQELIEKQARLFAKARSRTGTSQPVNQNDRPSTREEEQSDEDIPLDEEE